jgi:hypothetical protein
LALEGFEISRLLRCLSFYNAFKTLWLYNGVSLFVTSQALRLSLCVSLGVPQEFYVDGQPMCCHRNIVAGVENGNVTEANASKAGATAIK